MPVADDIKSSWADEVELEGGALPPPTEVFENGYKVVTEYAMNDDDQKIKIVRTYKMERCVVSKTVAERKNWAKFGAAANDKPGPNPASTVVGEEVYMQFIKRKEEDKPEEDALEKLKSLGVKSAVKCRTCSGDHWTSQCPWKDTLGNAKVEEKKNFAPGAGGSELVKLGGSKYVPPARRDGAGSSAPSAQRMHDALAIRIANLSEAVTEADLEELVKPFGPTSKVFLAKDKVTGTCKGFAYVHFKSRVNAAQAIEKLNGHGYDYLILSVDWSKPPAHSKFFL